MTRIAITTWALLVPGIAAAHPDHLSGGDFGVVHFVSDPFHVALTCAAVVLSVSLGRAVGRRVAIKRKAR